jgi:hypothetical protein
VEIALVPTVWVGQIDYALFGGAVEAGGCGGAGDVGSWTILNRARRRASCAAVLRARRGDRTAMR